MEDRVREELRRQEERIPADAAAVAAAWLVQREARVHADAAAHLAAVEAEVCRARALAKAADLRKIRRRHFAAAAAAELAAVRAAAATATAIGAAVEGLPADIRPQNWIGGWEGPE